MSFVQNTQIIWPSTINVTFNGTSVSPLGTPITLSFSPALLSLPPNTININGSGNAGKYLASHYTAPTVGLTTSFVSTLNFQGSGAGNLSGNPDVIYANITGSIRVFSSELYGTTTNLLTESSLLEFTAVCQIIISCDIVTLKFINQYAEVYLQNPPIPGQSILPNSPLITQFKLIFNSNDTFKILPGSASVIVSNNTRYINIGQFGISFTLT